MDTGIRTRILGETRYRTGTPDENKVPRLGHQVDTRYQHWDTCWIQGTKTGTLGRYKITVGHHTDTRYQGWDTRWIQGTWTGTPGDTRYQVWNTRRIQITVGRHADTRYKGWGRPGTRTGTPDGSKLPGLGHQADAKCQD